jgi:hypothetical protein
MSAHALLQIVREALRGCKHCGVSTQRGLRKGCSGRLRPWTEQPYHVLSMRCARAAVDDPDSGRLHDKGVEQQWHRRRGFSEAERDHAAGIVRGEVTGSGSVSQGTVDAAEPSGTERRVREDRFTAAASVARRPDAFLDTASGSYEGHRGSEMNTGGRQWLLRTRSKQTAPGTIVSCAAGAMLTDNGRRRVMTGAHGEDPSGSGVGEAVGTDDEAAFVATGANRASPSPAGANVQRPQEPNPAQQLPGRQGCDTRGLWTFEGGQPLRHPQASASKNAARRDFSEASGGGSAAGSRGAFVGGDGEELLGQGSPLQSRGADLAASGWETRKASSTSQGPRRSGKDRARSGQITTQKSSALSFWQRLEAEAARADTVRSVFIAQVFIPFWRSFPLLCVLSLFTSTLLFHWAHHAQVSHLM